MPDSINDIIQHRRSIRRYEDRPIPRKVLEKVLTAATYAPSAHNRQPWRFAVVSTPDEQRTLALAMGQRLRTDLTADRVPEAIIEKDVTLSYSRITKAAALVLVCMSMADMDRYPDEKRANAERLMAVQSTAMAVQNLLLAVDAEGLGACWMCAPLFCPDVVSQTLNLPTDWEPQALITMGYPAEQKTSTRQPLESKIVWR
jgi:F420 biosynthesis protein FbiB-like protein